MNINKMKYLCIGHGRRQRGEGDPKSEGEAQK